MDFAFWYTVVLIILMVIVLFKEWLETELTFFAVVLLLLVGRIITLDQAFVGFSNEGMLTIALLFIVAGALHNTGAVEQIERWILGNDHNGMSRKLTRILFPVSGISAFINNTPVVAILIPALRKWTERLDLSVSKFLIPVSFAAILGGMCTLIGTSTTLIIYGLMIDAGMEGLGFFEMTKVGVPVAIVGLLYLIFIGWRIIPERKKAFLNLEENTREFVLELKVTEAYQNIGKTIEDAGLRHLKGLFLFQIERNGKIIAPARPDEIIRLNDRLFFTGLPKTILEIQKTAGLQLLKDSKFDLKQYDSSTIKPFEAVVSPSSPLIGKNVRESNFRQKYDAVIIAIHRNGSRIDKKVGDIVLHAGDTLLLLADTNFFDKWYHSKDFYLVSQSDLVPSKPRWQAVFSMAVLAMMIGLAALNILPILTAAAIAAGLLLLTRTISTVEARQSLDFRVLAVIAMAFGLAEGLRESGVAEFVAHAIVQFSDVFGPIGVLAGIFIVTSLNNIIISNNATGAILFPIVIAAAGEMQLDPRPFIMGLVIAASASFASPISYQTNLMVYGPGGYRFKDFVKVGLPLQILVGIVALILIYVFYF